MCWTGPTGGAAGAAVTHPDCPTPYLEDFDLAGGRVQVLAVLAGVPLGKGVDLDPEGHALLAAVLPGGELGADAVHLRTGGDDAAVCSTSLLRSNHRTLWFVVGHVQQIRCFQPSLYFFLQE